MDEVLAIVDLPSGRLQRLLQRMQVLGLVEVVEPAARLDVRQPIPAISTFPPNAPAPAAPAVRPPLTAEQEETIRREYGRVRNAAPHEVLSLPERAPIKDVQRSYYALVQRFHPDVFFGRDLGTLESQLFEITQKHFEAYRRLRDAPAPQVEPPPPPASPDATASPSASPGPSTAPPEKGSLQGDAQEQFDKGLAFFRKNDYVKARPYFELACAFDPGNAGYREHLARVKKGLGIAD